MANLGKYLRRPPPLILEGNIDGGQISPKICREDSARKMYGFKGSDVVLGGFLDLCPEMLEEFQIGAIVSIMEKQHKPSGWTGPYLSIQMPDSIDVQLSNFLPQFMLFMDECAAKNLNIFVHCLMGVSRSPSFLIAHLMTLGKSYDQALSLIAEKRPGIQPNIGFECQLREMCQSCSVDSQEKNIHEQSDFCEKNPCFEYGTQLTEQLELFCSELSKFESSDSRESELSELSELEPDSESEEPELVELCLNCATYSDNCWKCKSYLG